MLEMLETDCAHTAGLIEKEGFYRWSEEHKQSLKIVADSITDFTYSLALYYSIMAGQNQACRKNNLMEKGANKLKNALKKAFSSENKGGSDLDIPNTKPSINQGKEPFRNADFKKPDIKMVNDAANQIGIDRKEFGNYIHEIKADLGMKANQNFTYQELLELAEEYKKLIE